MKSHTKIILFTTLNICWSKTMELLLMKNYAIIINENPLSLIMNKIVGTLKKATKINI